MCEELHDHFEDQVECARYRAERDALAQAVQAVCERMEVHCLGVEGMDDSPVASWARDLRAALGSLHAPVRDTTVGAYGLLPADEREAIAWVREHGGLERVKWLLDWCLLHDSKIEQLDFDFWLSGRVMYELGFEGDMADRDEVERRLLARLMPEGMEWLRYDTGEPVPLGGEVTVTVHDEDGDFDRTLAIRSIKYKESGVLLEGTKNEMVILSHGERVKRPAVSAADGDGCCEPGTYRCQEVAFTCDSCGHTVFVDKCMVDEIRYLRAKGIRTLNCCCGHGKRVEPFIIVNEGDECRMLNMGYERRVNKHGVTYFMPKSACPPKFIASDGEPLREGETVWDTNGDELVVGAFEDGGHTVTCRYADVGDGIPVHGMWSPSQLTHERPVLDADGVEIRVGDRVWTKAGTGMVVTLVESDKRVVMDGARGGRFVYPAYRLTHRAPVLAADGRPLREGEHVWHVETGTELVVKELPKTEEYQAVVVFALPTSPTSHLTSFDPDMLTHERLALDAGGAPIKVGDTVFRTSDGREFEVTGVDGAFEIRVKDESMDVGIWTTPCGFTHAKPEFPDSWERLEEDATISPEAYCAKRGIDFSDVDGQHRVLDEVTERMARDIVRRARALAGDA